MRRGKAPNTQENARARDAARQAERDAGRRMSDDEAQAFHRRISGNNFSYHEMVEEAAAVLRGE
jgi:hypothetical protein